MRDEGQMMTVQASDLLSTTDSPPTRRTDKPIDHTLFGRDESIIEFHGTLIGFATSFRDDHTHVSVDPETGQPLYVASGARCSSCRWFEVRIFTVVNAYVDDCTCGDTPKPYSDNELHVSTCGEVPPEGKYLVLTYGITSVPGESHKRRAVWTDSPYRIVEVLTQRNATGSFLPATSAAVISEAARWDEGILNAYLINKGNVGSQHYTLRGAIK